MTCPECGRVTMTPSMAKKPSPSPRVLRCIVETDAITKQVGAQEVR